MDELSEAQRLVNEAWENQTRWETNYADALSLLERAVSAGPAGPPLLTGLGAVLCDLARYEEASRVLEEAARLGSGDANTFYNLAVAVLNTTGSASRAAVHFRQASRLTPSALTWQAYFDPQAH